MAYRVLKQTKKQGRVNTRYEENIKNNGHFNATDVFYVIELPFFYTLSFLLINSIAPSVTHKHVSSLHLPTFILCRHLIHSRKLLS